MPEWPRWQRLFALGRTRLAQLPRWVLAVWALGCLAATLNVALLFVPAVTGVLPPALDQRALSNGLFGLVFSSMAFMWWHDPVFAAHPPRPHRRAIRRSRVRTAVVRVAAVLLLGVPMAALGCLLLAAALPDASGLREWGAHLALLGCLQGIAIILLGGGPALRLMVDKLLPPPVAPIPSRAERDAKAGQDGVAPVVVGCRPLSAARLGYALRERDRYNSPFAPLVRCIPRAVEIGINPDKGEA